MILSLKLVLGLEVTEEEMSDLIRRIQLKVKSFQFGCKYKSYYSRVFFS